MVDRIRKALQRLSAKELKQVKDVLRRIEENNLAGFHLKKLQGRDDVYRVRKGDIRIIFRRLSTGESIIIAIERRSDTTYNEF